MKISRLCSTLLIGLALPALVHAQATSAESKNFLWQVQRGETTLYLLGSVHVMREDSYSLSPVIEGAFDDSEVVAFETDLDDMTSAALQMLSAGTLEPGTSLKDVVGPEVWTQLEIHARKTGYAPLLSWSSDSQTARRADQLPQALWI